MAIPDSGKPDKLQGDDFKSSDLLKYAEKASAMLNKPQSRQIRRPFVTTTSRSQILNYSS